MSDVGAGSEEWSGLAQIVRENHPGRAEYVEKRQGECRVLAKSLGDRVRDLLYRDGVLEHVKIEDPGAIDEFWRLNDLVDKRMAEYLEGKVLWDSDDWDHPEQSVMGAARELFVYLAAL